MVHVDGAALEAAAARGKVDVQVYGYALSHGRVLDSLVLQTTLNTALVPAPLGTAGLKVLATLSAVRGPVDLRFFVRAGSAGDTGSIRRQLEVPAFAEGEAVLSPPMAILPATRQLVAPVQTRRNPPLEIPFRLRGAPFLPDTSPAWKRGVPRELCVFVWPSQRASDPLEVEAELVRPGEPPVPVRIEGVPRVVPDADGFDRYVVTVVPPPAPHGGQVVRLRFRNAGNTWTATTQATVAWQE
jgi:hypothetical protein